jgi:transcriptional regulator with XRE-family HTH domain
VAGETLAILLKRLRELRRRHALSQEAFAERAGMSYKYYQAVEAGRKPNLRLSTLEKLAAPYGLEVWQLLSPSMPRKTGARRLQ